MVFIASLTVWLLIIINAAPDISGFRQSEQNDVIIDSQYSFADAVAGKEFPLAIRRNLVITEVEYFSFDGKRHRGQLLIHKDLEKDIREIFSVILERKFPIGKVIPIVRYGWSDEKSMLDNNTSAFNYRNVAGTNRLSNHAYGTAIDINPYLNPYIKGKYISPKGSEYNPEIPGTITADSFLVKEFKKRGWTWGGDWKSLKDYQHFEKKLK